MNIKKFLSILLACLLAVSLLPSAAAIDYALYADSAASVRSGARAPAADAGPRSFMTAAVDEAEQDGAAFHPYVFTVDENASVSASVRMQPALMAFSPAGAPNSQKGAAKGGPDRELSSMTVYLDSEYPFGATVPINVTVNSGSNGTVTVTVRCEDHLESHTETVTDGIMTLYFSGTCAGPHNVTATYSGNEQFLPCSDTTAFTVLDDGDGGLFTPFRIGNAAQLEHFRDVVNAGRSDACAVLTSDIDLGDAAWTPIGYFTGWLDGAGHVISGLHVSAENNSGLFAEIYGGVVERLGVKGSVSATWSSGNDACAGGIAAGIFNETIISGCWFNGTVAASSKENRYAYAGGIAGHITDDAAIQDCFTDCTVHAESDSENSAGAAQAGGIVGVANGGSVSFCYHTGNVTIDGYREVPEASPRGNADGIGTIVGSVTECYYLDGTASSVTGVPLTAAQFNQTDSFFVADSNSKTWNFDEVWYLNEAEGRPMLREASSIDLELESFLSSGQNLNINATVSSADATGLIELIIYNEDGSKTHSLEVENGKAYFFSDPFSGGRYYLTANYDGGKRFLPCMARGSFEVEDSWSCLQQDIESGNPVKLLTNVTCTEHEQSRGPIVIPENANVTIDLNGFTIDRSLTDAAVNGSVIYVGRNASLVILDSVGTGSINGGNTTGGGGAIHVAGGGKLTVSNVTFINNTAALYGGAIFGSKTAQIILNNSTFSGNRAAQGGAIYASDDTRLSISDCSFVNNTASYFGAIHMPGADAVVNRSSFIRNTSEDSSGVIGSAWDSPGSGTITNCILLGNKAGSYLIGFAAEEGKSADSNWFGSTAENYTVNPGCTFAVAWNYINFTRAIDNATGQYAFRAELWLYNSTSSTATAVAPENYTLPAIRLAGFTEGAEISTGGALVLSQAGYVNTAFTPMLNTTSYTVGFVYPGITGIGDQLTFNRTIRVNVGEGQNLT